MTIKELAEFTGKNKSTVGRWVAKCNSGIISKLQNATKENPADFIINEVEEILNAGSMSKDAVSILMSNARKSQQIATIESNPIAVMMDFMAKMQKQQQDFMSTVISEMKTLKQPVEHIQIGSTLLPERVLFRKLVDKLVNIAKVDHSTTYSRIYAEMGYVYGVKIKARAKNRNKKPIEVLEEDMLLGKAIAIVTHFIEVVESKRGFNG